MWILLRLIRSPITTIFSSPDFFFHHMSPITVFAQLCDTSRNFSIPLEFPFLCLQDCPALQLEYPSDWNNKRVQFSENDVWYRTFSAFLMCLWLLSALSDWLLPGTPVQFMTNFWRYALPEDGKQATTSLSSA